jgi:hypothetical protein
MLGNTNFDRFMATNSDGNDQAISQRFRVGRIFGSERVWVEEERIKTSAAEFAAIPSRGEGRVRDDLPRIARERLAYSRT